jgi:DNA-binding response OmpR family regulator
MPTFSSQCAKIALLEDDVFFAKELMHQLACKRYDVTHFVDATVCIQTLFKEDFDLCIFDYHLPKTTGQQVMERLKIVNRLPPVIFLTGNDSEETITEILLSGADDYIIKPPQVPVLKARIQALLRRSSLRFHSPGEETLGDISINYKEKTIFKDGRVAPDGHFKFPHPWPPQIPPGSAFRL